ncbi:MAG: trypsin-like serine protease [Sandaracinaceae bacterium]|nr:trypsin-like serine protease [Sandaracinaceae bacterium]
MRRLGFVALPLLSLAGCAPPMPDATATPIVDGTFEPAEEAVVLVTAFGAVGLCTGTLIAPNVVLTAKHCVQAPGVDGPYPVSALTVGVGSRAGATRDYRARYVDTTPGAYQQSPTTGLSGEIFGVDVAVVILRAPVEGVTPIPVRRDRPDDRIGQPFTAIGFGRRPDGDAGLKYRTEGVLESLTEAGILFTQQVICSGDSGGPMIQETPERRVIGVASFGEAGNCPSRRDGYNGVWSHLGLIDRALVLGGNCLGLDEACNSLDDDCDGIVDEGCVPYGGACASDDECANAQLPGFLDPLASPVACVDLGAGRVCARPCDPTRPRASCAALEGLDGAGPALDGHVCRRDGCDGFCVPGAPGAASDDASCGADAECASLYCADPGDGRARCLATCRPGRGECPLGEVCVGAAGSCGGCVSGALVSGTRSLGEPCATDADCAERCVAGACVVGCSAAEPCPFGYACEVGACVRRHLGGAGDPCVEGADCGPELSCTTDGARRWCAPSCASAPCPAGMECAGEVCAPSGALLGEACGAGCASGGACEDDRCTRACGAGEPCPVGFDCRRDGAGRARCLRPATGGGGCAASAAPSRAGAWALLVAVAAVAPIGRRRRRR